MYIYMYLYIYIYIYIYVIYIYIYVYNTNTQIHRNILTIYLLIVFSATVSFYSDIFYS